MEIPTTIEIVKDIAIASIGFIFYIKNVLQNKQKFTKINKRIEILDKIPQLVDEAEHKIKGEKIGETRKYIVQSQIKEDLYKSGNEYTNDIDEKIENYLKTPQATIYKEREKEDEKNNAKTQSGEETRHSVLQVYSKQNEEN